MHHRLVINRREGIFERGCSFMNANCRTYLRSKLHNARTLGIMTAKMLLYTPLPCNIIVRSP